MHPVVLFPAQVGAWVLYVLALTPLWLLGWPVCAVLSVRRAWAYLPSPYFSRRVFLWPYRWAFPWNSFEDGVTGNAKWNAEHQSWPVWLRALVWCAWRNPVDAMRFVYPFGIRFDPPRIRVRANCPNSPQDDWTGERVLWCYVWQGVFAGLWIRWPRRRRVVWRRVLRFIPWPRIERIDAYGQVRIGWRLFPRDARGVPPDDGRVPGCGFALQFHWRRMG